MATLFEIRDAIRIRHILLSRHVYKEHTTHCLIYCYYREMIRNRSESYVQPTFELACSSNWINIHTMTQFAALCNSQCTYHNEELVGKESYYINSIGIRHFHALCRFYLFIIYFFN